MAVPAPPTPAPAPPAPPQLVPMPAIPPAPSSTPEAPTDAAAAAAEPDPQAPEPLTAGRHRCSFTEAGSDYNRRCEVTLQADGSLRVSASGTALNPGQGFTITATGSAPRYSATGTLNAFGSCTGAFRGTLELGGSDSHPFYAIEWGSGCKITIVN
ncbi:MAG: hypothetical protein HY909_17365 [Deltaproteobacteria bacterium]|nr:hypothetical protein [Deltaproteobacteria bacterium]